MAEAVVWPTLAGNKYRRRRSLSTLILKRAKARGRDTANRLRRFSSEVRRERRKGGLALPGLRRYLARRRKRNGFGNLAGKQGDVNILEDLTGRDAENTVGGFDEKVAFATGVLTAEGVGKTQAGGELFGFDQKTGAVSNP